MTRTIAPLALLLASLSFAMVGCDGKADDDAAPAVTEAESTSAAPAVRSTAPAEAIAETAAAGAEVAAAGAANAGAKAVPAAAAPGGEKTFDCGGKGQKLCPMQAWMKSTMAAASSSDDGGKIAEALLYAAGKAPPGMSRWASIAKDGAEKAKSGDIDGAKASCKKCHDTYKAQYKKTMRDRPW